MYCTKCGTENVDDSIFCTNCGTNIGNDMDVDKKRDISKKMDVDKKSIFPAFRDVDKKRDISKKMDVDKKSDVDKKRMPILNLNNIKIKIKNRGTVAILFILSILLMTSVFFLYTGDGENRTDTDNNNNVNVTIFSTPPNADIYINEEWKGVSPETISLPIGNYNLKMNMTGYFGIRSNVAVTPDAESLEVNVTFEHADKSTTAPSDQL